MVLSMARPWKHPKTQTYYLRRRVPHDLRALVGTDLVKRTLGTKDPVEAKRRLLEVQVELEAQWANLRAGTRSLTEREAHALAEPMFDRWLAMHRAEPSQQYQWHPAFYDRLWTEPAHDPDPAGEQDTVFIDRLLITAMRTFCFAQADFGLEAHGLSVDDHSRFKFAKAVGAAVQRASLALEREAEGIYAPGEQVQGSGQPLALTRAVNTVGQSLERRAPTPTTAVSKITITGLLEGWWREANAAGRKPSTHESYRNTVRAFVAFLEHDDADRLTADDVIRFKDHRLVTPSPKTGRVPTAKTVKDSDLAGLKTVFGWAVTNRKLASNPAQGITIKVGKPQRLRSKGFNDAEAVAILTAATRHKPGNESHLTVAKRWVPWLCAFTGARVGEVAQLRKQDVTQQGEHWVMRITPEAGTVKTNEAREVVLHRQVVELGFPAFVISADDGHLFLKPGKAGDVRVPLRVLKNRLAEFARAVVPDPNVAPNHGWRHRFKTVGMEAGVAPRILDSIQGQAPRSVADTYGDVTIRAVATAIALLPRIEIEPQQTVTASSEATTPLHAGSRTSDPAC